MKGDWVVLVALGGGSGGSATFADSNRNWNTSSISLGDPVD